MFSASPVPSTANPLAPGHAYSRSRLGQNLHAVNVPQHQRDLVMSHRNQEFNSLKHTPTTSFLQTSTVKISVEEYRTLQAIVVDHKGLESRVSDLEAELEVKDQEIDRLRQKATDLPEMDTETSSGVEQGMNQQTPVEEGSVEEMPATFIMEVLHMIEVGDGRLRMDYIGSGSHYCSNHVENGIDDCGSDIATMLREIGSTSPDLYYFFQTKGSGPNGFLSPTVCAGIDSPDSVLDWVYKIEKEGNVDRIWPTVLRLFTCSSDNLDEARRLADKARFFNASSIEEISKAYDF